MRRCFTYIEVVADTATTIGPSPILDYIFSPNKFLTITSFEPWTFGLQGHDYTPRLLYPQLIEYFTSWHFKIKIFYFVTCHRTVIITKGSTDQLISVLHHLTTWKLCGTIKTQKLSRSTQSYA